MSDINEQAMKLLIPLLRERRPILMVGAGSSMFVGYLSWGGLIDKMAAELIPPLQKADGISVTEFGQLVKEQFQNDQRMDDYHNLLERLNGPYGKEKQYDQMHVSLVRLGFSGITTTNYDPVLEMAISKAFESDLGPFHCEPVDMCAARAHGVHEFMEGLTERRNPHLVLHLHGYYRNPEGIILTEFDYKQRYGIEPQFDQNGRPVDRDLGSLHRRVLYSLLLRDRFFFTGFSLSDKFFMHVLSIVQDEFQLGTAPRHFATMSYKNEEDRESQRRQLERQGVLPLFYYVPPTRDGELEGHSALRTLIFEIEKAVRGYNPEDSTYREPSRDWREVASRMIER